MGDDSPCKLVSVSVPLKFTSVMVPASVMGVSLPSKLTGAMLPSGRGLWMIPGGACRRKTSASPSGWVCVRGAQPGILMPGTPQVGVRYHQEFYAGEAEDLGEVLRTGTSVSVPAGDYTHVLVTENTTPLEPKIREHKYYSAGVGLVEEDTVAGGSERFELIRVIGL